MLPTRPTELCLRTNEACNGEKHITRHQQERYGTGGGLLNSAGLLVLMIWATLVSTFLYACESWILTKELQRRIQAMEMICYRKTLRISYKDHFTNEEVRARIQQAIGPHEDLLTIVKRRRLQCMVMFPVHQLWPKPSCKAQ